MSKKNSMNKTAKNVADDVCDSKKARINKLKKMEKDSKQKLEKSPEDKRNKVKPHSWLYMKIER